MEQDESEENNELTWMRPLFIRFNRYSTSLIENEVGTKANDENNVEQVISAVRRVVQAHGKQSALSKSVGEVSYIVEQDNTTRIGDNGGVLEECPGIACAMVGAVEE
ncbi:hypothetical protein FA95DRAFT_1577395 [Auriscalpium vulgare]|uniref:Uncharacterized protein n=1 Tax=Auriscalpium vulgare TaxID=40419 RepID=A0ACB8R755_9AGAM|nr:hypothetical protein FA95DRAFT_1577395 [Auriscalpium vulgare]